MKTPKIIDYYFYLFKKYKKYSNQLRRRTEGTLLRLSFKKQRLLKKRLLELKQKLEILHSYFLKAGIATGSALILTFSVEAQEGPFVASSAKNPLKNVIVSSRKGSPSFVDIDKDGDKDLFYGAGDGKFYFHRNTGTISSPIFVADADQNPLKTFDVGNNSTPSFIDIDLDGDSDAVSGSSSSTLKFYKNTGSALSPVFIEQTGIDNPLTGISTTRATFADLDKDGDLDLVTEKNFTNSGSLGNDKFGFAYYKNIGTATKPKFVVQEGTANPLKDFTEQYQFYGYNPKLADLDRDGDYDLIAGRFWYYYSDMLYFKNIGTPSTPLFTSTDNDLTNITISNPQGNYTAEITTTFEDLDNDGDLDAFIGSHKTTFVYYENFGGDSLNLTNFSPADGVEGRLITLNGTGLKNTEAVLINDVTAPFTIINNTKITATVPASASTGLIKVVTESDTAVYANQFQVVTGVTPFVKKSGTENPLQLFHNSLYQTETAFVDIDDDGDSDVFVGVDDILFDYYKNIGTKTKPIFQRQTGVNNPLNQPPDNYIFSTPEFADIDNDGDFDAVLGHLKYLNGGFRYWENVGNKTTPSFVERTGSLNPFNNLAADVSTAPTLVDIDGDGDLDLFNGTTMFFKNVGSPSAPIFELQPNTNNPLSAISPRSFDFVDIDKDGDYDVFVGHGGSWTVPVNVSVKYYKNIGTPSNALYTEIAGANNPLSIVEIPPYEQGYPYTHYLNFSSPDFVDIDNDGDDDVFVGAPNSIHYFENETFVDSTLTFTSFSPQTARRGDEITLKGLGFKAVESVKFGNNEINFTVADNTTIKIRVPEDIESELEFISVINPNDTLVSPSPINIILPAITSFTPASGFTQTSLTIQGTDFNGTKEVKINDKNLVFGIVDKNTIKAVIPLGATSGLIQVITSIDTLTSSQPFEVVPASITELSPATGGVIGQTVTIHGTGFDGVTSVKFGWKQAAYTFVNSTTLTTIVPEGLYGSVLVKVAARGEIAVSADKFTVFTPEPTIPSSNIQALAYSNYAKMKWTKGNGSKRLVVLKENSNPINLIPEDGEDYEPHPELSDSASISGNQVIYNWTGNSVTVTGLKNSTVYKVFIYEHNGNGANTNYLLTEVSHIFGTGDGDGLLNARNASNGRADSSIEKKEGYFTEEQDVLVYPNPFADEVNLHPKGLENKKVFVAVSSMHGGLVYETASNSNETITIGKNFPSGIYLVKINWGTGFKVFKIVKM